MKPAFVFDGEAFHKTMSVVFRSRKIVSKCKIDFPSPFSQKRPLEEIKNPLSFYLQKSYYFVEYFSIFSPL